MKHAAPLAFLLVAAAALLWRDAGAAESSAEGDTGTDDTGAGWFDGLADWLPAPISEALDMTTPSTDNRAAFLAMIRRSETGSTGPRAYSMLYGGGTFASFADHPRQLVTAGKWTSTAAGAYQILARTWDDLRRSGVDLPDFSPANQDKAAIALLKRRGALPAIDRGDLAAAILAARKEWASLAGAGYGQPENTLATLTGWYQQNGGALA